MTRFEESISNLNFGYYTVKIYLNGEQWQSPKFPSVLCSIEVEGVDNPVDFPDGAHRCYLHAGVDNLFDIRIIRPKEEMEVVDGSCTVECECMMPYPDKDNHDEFKYRSVHPTTVKIDTFSDGVNNYAGRVEISQHYTSQCPYKTIKYVFIRSAAERISELKQILTTK